jgi:hypothetical protein
MGSSSVAVARFGHFSFTWISGRLRLAAACYEAPRFVEAHAMTGPIDYIEIGRVAYELSERHGRNAHCYATKQAELALAKGAIDEQRFWEAVAVALKPRESS